MREALRPSRRLLFYRLGMLAGATLVIVAALGEWLGWWRDLGVGLGLIGLLATFLFGVGSASEETVLRLDPPLERMSDDMATVRVVLERSAGALERIERLLGERLPLR